MDDLTALEERFLEYLIKTFHKAKSYVKEFIDLSVVERAVNLFISYYMHEDQLRHTNHSDIIKAVFVEDNVTNTNCCSNVGVSPKSLHRYKQKYLLVFRKFLLQCIGNNQLFISGMA